ncbi:hypothetical protein L9F63_016040 [Diploptera punctata]|uniref:Uncharacterized protein n=1 Tax=Diploptera punctata TaxID=6984 RepID=A0AAD8A398_DIPPU|nr:hypothetical protein L9F63_016040 [Diploptera punctata]
MITDGVEDSFVGQNPTVATHHHHSLISTGELKLPTTNSKGFSPQSFVTTSKHTGNVPTLQTSPYELQVAPSSTTSFLPKSDNLQVNLPQHEPSLYTPTISAGITGAASQLPFTSSQPVGEKYSSEFQREHPVFTPPPIATVSSISGVEDSFGWSESFSYHTSSS